jgi:hypothetical protein
MEAIHLPGDTTIHHKQEFPMTPIHEALTRLTAIYKDDSHLAQAAAAYTEKEDYDALLAAITPLADEGNGEAQFILGTCYFYGRGVAQDTKRGITYWTEAATQGIAPAQTALGAYHASKGRHDEARKCFEQAAVQGDIHAATALHILDSQQPPSAAVQRAIHILQAGDGDGARRKLEDLAAAGNLEAIRFLAVMFQQGIGVPQNYEIAREWWLTALELNDATAQYALGEQYYNGTGVATDYEQARYYWEQAAAQNHADAQYGLGILYREGHGVPADQTLAHTWLEKAATQGHTTAQTDLGRHYLGTQEFSQAQKWLQAAADADDADAQYLLGLSYIFANDAVANFDKIHALWHRAAEQGHPGAEEALKKLHGE